MCEKEQNYIDYLARCWNKTGINHGDVLLIHSSMFRLMRQARRRHIKLMPEHVLKSFMLAVGETGTLLFPTFKIQVSDIIDFDICNTPSSMGALTEVARKHPDAIRTEHPILSFAVIGRKAMHFKKCSDFTGIGKGSPFDLLHKYLGKIAVLGLPENDSMSFYHYVEQVNDVSYRWTIHFDTLYVNDIGVKSKRKYGYYARKRDDGIVTNVEPMGQMLWDKGFYSGDKYNEGNGLRVIKASDIFAETDIVIKSGQSLDYLYNCI